MIRSLFLRAFRAVTFSAATFVFVLICPARAASAETAEAEDWLALFNGKNLDGWVPKITGHALGDNYSDTFRVSQGVLKVSYDGYESFDGRFGHLFFEKPYAYYRLRIEYRFTGEQAPGGPGAWAVRNSGVMVHSQAPETMPVAQDFPISIEAQFLGGLGDGAARPTGNVCTPGTEIVYHDRIYPHHCLPAAAPTLDGDQWVSIELIVLGGAQITHRVNGERVLEYQLPQIGGGVVHQFEPSAKPDGQLLGSGYLAVHSESHPIEFRRIELLNLEGCMDAGDPNYRSYHVKSDRKACRG